ncbi:MAG: heavy metal translocating P-type ATPase, partial [Kofleriaceae bacterium]|nr:heavy metal translocating P-type ATPase [Kofleriaceae bacterium]
MADDKKAKGDLGAFFQSGGGVLSTKKPRPAAPSNGKLDHGLGAYFKAPQGKRSLLSRAGDGHVHGPGCGHDHGERDHGHDEGHVHGPGCGHDHGHDQGGHVHGPGCGHDHGGDDHGHEHAGHDKAHVHGPGCGHDHGHDDHDHGHEHGPGCGHDHDDHDGHDHSSCGHDHHHHGPKKRQNRPPQYRPAETGGAAVQLALDQLLPEENDEDGIFDHFEKALLSHRAITKVHIRRDLGRAEICVHHGDGITPTELIDLACRSGAECTERFEHVTWFVRGLESADSAAPLEALVAKLPGVLTANVAYAAERLVVEFDAQVTTADAITKAVEKLGYQLEVPEHGHACSMHAHGGGLAPWLQMPLAIGAGVLLGVGFALEKLAASTVPAALTMVMYVIALVAAALFPLRAAVNAIRAKQVDVETLMILAGIGAGVLGAWFEGAFLLFLFTLGHALEHRAMEKARRSIEALGQLTVKTARVRRDNQVVEVSTKQIAIGDVVVVRAGDRVPLDGVIREGKSLIDQATITGESVPVARGPGEKVFAGTINTDAVIEVEVTSLAGDTLLARIVDMVAEAEAHKSSTQRFVQRLEKKFVPLVLVIAAAVPAVLIATGTAWELAVLRGVSLIVAASPCALAISTPSAVLAAVSRAARGGVLIKGGAHLEALGRIRALAFDKTGTLTHGKPKLVSVVAAEGVAENDLLANAAGLEGLSNHPLAKAVLAGAAERGVAPLAAEEGDAVHGKGIQGQVDGKRVRIGNLAMFEGEALPDALVGAAADLEGKGQTTMIVWREGAFLGVLGVADTLRSDASAALGKLADLGIDTTIMLSGDNARVAKSIASSVGIKEV